MLLKKNRANKKDLDKVFKKGFFLASTNLTFRYLKDKTTKISFVTPKTVSKSAVKRNGLRRKGYALLKKHLELLPSPITAAFVFKKSNTENLENEIKNLLTKAN
ncbi:MAG: ribonuclease P protein component [bacterium]|nr:ribonuclease P protein component [bacterium]